MQTMSQELQQYLSNMQARFQAYKGKEKVKVLSNLALADIDNEIFDSRLTIPDKEKQLSLKLKTAPEFEKGIEDLQKQSKEIAEKKKALMRDLESIDMMESQIRMGRSTITKNSSSLYEGKNAKIRSTLTEDEKASIKQIRKRQKKFERKLQAKIAKFEDDMRAHNNKTMEEEENRHHQNGMAKHKQREEYIQEIKQRKKIREQALEIQKQKIAQLKKQRKLFELMEEKYSTIENQKEMLKTRQLEDFKKKREFSFDVMKEHERNYDEEHARKECEREERVKGYTDANKPKHECRFLENIRQEEQLVRFEEQEKNELKRTLLEKKAAYAESVRKILHENSKSRQARSVKGGSSEKSRLNRRPLGECSRNVNATMSISEKYHKGTEYMRVVNGEVSKLPRKNAQTSTQSKPRFKNYLAELKQEHRERKLDAHTMSNMAALTNMAGAKENISSVNLVKSVKAKLSMMKQLQNR